MRSWKKSFSALWAAEFLAIAGFSTSNPILPLYLAELGVEDKAALNWWNGAITTAPAIALAVFAPIWGSLADRYGRKLMLLRAMIGGSILVGLCAITTAPWQVLVLKTLQGCVTGTVAAATVLTASIVPLAEAGYYLGLMQMAVYLGNSAGPLFGGVVTDLVGSRINFLATAVMLAAAAYIVMRRVEEDFAPSGSPGRFRPRDALPDFAIVAATPALAPLLIVIFGVSLASNTAGPILPLVIRDMTGSAPGTASLSGLIIGVTSIAGAIAAALIGKVSGRIGYGRTLLGCLAGAFIFSLPQALARDPYTLLALRAGAGIFMGGTMPSVNALIAQLCDPARQGSTYGLSSSMSSVGGALGPVLGAFAATAFGYPSVFWVTSALLGLIAGGIALALGRRQAAMAAASPAAAAAEGAGIRRPGGVDELRS